MTGAGRVLFAAIFLLIAGTLNIIYGIGAIADANFYANDTRYILTNLNALGWALIILGVIQLTGGFSLMAGRVWGRLRRHMGICRSRCVHARRNPSRARQTAAHEDRRV